MKKSAWKVLAATLALGASLIVGGCGGSNTAERPKDEIVYVNFRDTRDLNPHLFAGEMYAQKLLYDTLITIRTARMHPRLRRAGRSARMV